MDQLLAGSPWGVKMVVYFGSILLQFFALYAIPYRWLQWAGKKGCTANAVSIARVPITWIGIALYLTDGGYWGFNIIVFGFLLDFMDGRIAAALKMLNDPRYPGVTELGKILDPACDKLCIVPFFLLLVLAQTGLFSFFPCIAMAGFEILGTLIRPPFIKLKVWPFRRLRRRIRRSDATGVGKTKMVVQCVTLLATSPYHLGWWNSGSLWFEFAVWGIVILAAASVASRLRFHKAVDESVDSFTGAFNHVNGIFGFLKNGKNGTGVAKVDSVVANGTAKNGSANNNTNGRKP